MVDKPEGIYKKLLEFQKLGISIKKDSTNPHFRNTYASLDEVLSKVKPELNKLGVVLIQEPEMEGLLTTLFDTDSGTKTYSNVPYVGATDMQKLGGAISYAKRYALIAMLALEDEDLDGENTIDRSKIVGTAPVNNNEFEI